MILLALTILAGLPGPAVAAVGVWWAGLVWRHW
jgi:hypothetical protein